jgi:hypothetical protein
MFSRGTPIMPASFSRAPFSFARTRAEARLGEDGLNQLSCKASAYTDCEEGKGLVVALLSKYAIRGKEILPVCRGWRNTKSLPDLQAVLTRQTITVGLKNSIDVRRITIKLPTDRIKTIPLLDDI